VNGSASSGTYSYDDAARRRTMVAGGVTQIDTFDTNGNPVQSQQLGSGISSTTNYATVTTAEVCK
jgi:hypothetical protein